MHEILSQFQIISAALRDCLKIAYYRLPTKVTHRIPPLCAVSLPYHSLLALYTPDRGISL
jgi:hypothetical protein